MIMWLFVAVALLGVPLQSPQRFVDAFLQTWLVDKNISSLHNLFAEKAFDSKLMLINRCAGDKDNENQSSIDRRQKVVEFTSQVARSVEGQNVKDMLEVEERGEGHASRKGKILSAVGRDKYLLYQGRDLNVGAEGDWDYLKAKFPSSSYLSLILSLKERSEGQTKIIPIGIVFMKEGRGWKVIHVETSCE